MNSPWDIGIPAHEFGQHYTYGGCHNETMGVYNLNGGGLASASDREVLGWNTNSAMTSSTNTTFTLRDYFTTGDYVKIKRTNDSIYLENRGRNNYYSSNDFRKWKWLSTDPKYPVMADSGLLIYRQTETNEFDIQSANGRWNWATCPSNNKYRVQFFSNSYNFFQQKTLNRFSGETTFNLINKPSLSFDCEQIANPFGGFINSVSYMGVNGDSNTCYDLDYNQVYSPWSNPPLPVSNSNDSITIELTGRNSNGSLNVNVYYTNILAASPSKPQGLSAIKYSSSNGFHPLLNWNRNLEPDLAGYNIYRMQINLGIGEPPTLDSIAYTTDTTFIDWSVFLYGTSSGQCSVYVRYEYKISSVDLTSKESVMSEKTSIDGYHGICAEEEGRPNQIINEQLNKDFVNEYKLYNNYPNPFNPTTEILFDLPQFSFVILKIYDVMGREIKTLINEKMPEGRHSVSFNAQNLPSGVYYYKLQADNYSNVKKLILLK